jgi:hypothetical protein
MKKVLRLKMSFSENGPAVEEISCKMMFSLSIGAQLRKALFLAKDDGWANSLSEHAHVYISERRSTAG